MKKDKEWLKKEFDEVIEFRKQSNPSSIWGMVINATLKYIKENFKNLIDQLEEPEVLSQEWIDDNSVNASHDGVTDEYVHVSDLENLLVPTISEMETVDITEGQIMDWLDDNDFYHHATAETVLANAVDKGELGYYGTKYSVVKKPVIPKYVGEFIEEVKDSGYRLDGAFLILRGTYHQNKTADWVAKESRNSETFARAWLDGYEVEEEPKYYALVKGHELTDSNKVYWVHDKINGDMFIGTLHSSSVYFLSEMSESEWNELGINDSNADFVEVEE